MKKVFTKVFGRCFKALSGGNRERNVAVPVKVSKKLVVCHKEKELVFGDIHRRLRPQLAAVLESLIVKKNHCLYYEDLNEIISEHYFDGSISSKQRIRTLKRSLRLVLTALPFEIVRSEAGWIRLVRTDGLPFEGDEEG